MGSIFDYSADLTYPEVGYHVLYGFIDGSLNFDTDQEVKCLEIIGNYYTNLTTQIP